MKVACLHMTGIVKPYRDRQGCRKEIEKMGEDSEMHTDFASVSGTTCFSFKVYK